MLGYFKVRHTDKPKTVIKKMTISSLIVLVLSIIPVIFIFLLEKKHLDKNYHEYLSKMGGYVIKLSSEYDDYAKGKVHINEFGKKFLRKDYERKLFDEGYKAVGEGFRMYIYKYQFKDKSILYEEGYASDVKYSQDLEHKDFETFQEPGRYIINYSGNIEYIPGELKQREIVTEVERTPVEECFKICKEYYLEKIILPKGFKKVNLFKYELRDAINGGNKYYYFESDVNYKSNSYTEVISNAEFNIDISVTTSGDRLVTNLSKLGRLLIFCFLLLIAIPFVYYTRFIILKVK